MIHTIILLQDSILVVFAGERTCVHAPQFSGVLNRKCCIRGNRFYKLPIHEKCALHVRCNCRLFYSTITILPLWSSTCMYTCWRIVPCHVHTTTGGREYTTGMPLGSSTSCVQLLAGLWQPTRTLSGQLFGPLLQKLGWHKVSLSFCSI